MLDDLPKSSKEVFEYRLNICKSCDRMDEPVAEVLVCMECGCDLNHKLWMPDHCCPLFKWGFDESI